MCTCHMFMEVLGGLAGLKAPVLCSLPRIQRASQRGDGDPDGDRGHRCLLLGSAHPHLLQRQTGQDL